MASFGGGNVSPASPLIELLCCISWGYSINISKRTGYQGSVCGDPRPTSRTTPYLENGLAGVLNGMLISFWPL